MTFKDLKLKFSRTEHISQDLVKKRDEVKKRLILKTESDSLIKR